MAGLMIEDWTEVGAEAVVEGSLDGWTEVAGPDPVVAEPPPTELPSVPAQFSPQTFFQQVAVSEGSGTEVAGDVPTAHFGVTEAAATAVGEPFSETMSEEMSTLIGTKYISKLEKDFAGKVEGWDFLPLAAREAAIDTAYNVGPQVLGWTGFMSALEEGDVEKAALNLLDTAKVDEKAMKGVAKRRAEQYNSMVGEHKIDKVEQKEDGTLIYWSGETEIFSYKPSGGRHEDSSVGSISV